MYMTFWKIVKQYERATRYQIDSKEKYRKKLEVLPSSGDRHDMCFNRIKEVSEESNSKC